MRIQKVESETKQSAWAKELASVEEIFRQKNEIEARATVLQQEVLELRAHINTMGSSKDILEMSVTAVEKENRDLSKVHDTVSQQLNHVTCELKREKDENANLIHEFMTDSLPAVNSLRLALGLPQKHYGVSTKQRLLTIADSINEVAREVESRQRRRHNNGHKTHRSNANQHGRFSHQGSFQQFHQQAYRQRDQPQSACASAFACAPGNSSGGASAYSCAPGSSSGYSGLDNYGMAQAQRTPRNSAFELGRQLGPPGTTHTGNSNYGFDFNPSKLYDGRPVWERTWEDVPTPRR
eukprot:gene30-705_t